MEPTHHALTCDSHKIILVTYLPWLRKSVVVKSANQWFTMDVLLKAGSK